MHFKNTERPKKKVASMDVQNTWFSKKLKICLEIECSLSVLFGNKDSTVRLTFFCASFSKCAHYQSLSIPYLVKIFVFFCNYNQFLACLSDFLMIFLGIKPIFIQSIVMKSARYWPRNYLCFFRLDAVDSKSTFYIIQKTEVFLCFINGNNICKIRIKQL